MKPLISIIIPVYNVEEYISRCLDSVIEQTYEHLEIIVVDDGATDKSGFICDKYALKDTRIKVIHKANGGLSSARNTGLDVATGEYISFIDSDDYTDKEYIYHLYRALVDSGSDVSVCGFHYSADTSSEFCNEDGIEPEIIQVLNCKEAMRQALRGSISHCAWGKLYKAALFEEVRFPVGKQYEDIAVFYEILLDASYIVVSTEKHYYYTVRSGSIMTESFSLKQLDEIDIIDTAMDKVQTEFPDMGVLINARRINSYLIVLSRIYRCRVADQWKEARIDIRRRIKRSAKGVLKDPDVTVTLKSKLISYMIGERVFFLLQKIADNNSPAVKQ